MVSEVVKRKIVQLSLDDSQLRRGLSNANNNLRNFTRGLGNVKTSSIDNLGKTTSNLGDKLGNLSKHIPIFNKMTEGMSGISKGTTSAVSGISQVGNEVQKLSGQFNMLQGVATVALGNIATTAISKLGSIVKQWTIAPISQGFAEYERELDTTRILETALEGDEKQASKIEPTMRALEKYASTTKYNSQQLNSTLSKMVNTGIDIEESRDAIIGFYNLAASSGASNAQATAAMEFGVTQSLATGYMGKQDWNSINNAGMGTMKFKNTLFERAKDMDPERMEQLLEEYGSINALFAQGLGEEKWLTADVFLGALQDYSKDETLLQQASNLYTFREALEATSEGVNDAWSKVWSNVLGKGTDAQQIWTPVGNVMTAIATAVPNTIIGVAKAFNAIEGRKVVIDAIVTGFKSLSSIVSAIGKAFTDVFPISKTKMFHESITDLNGKAEGISAVFFKIAQTITSVAKVMKEKFKIDPAVPNAVREIFKLIFTGFKMVLTLGGFAIKIMEVLIPDNLISNIIIIIGYFATLANTVIGFLGKLGSNISLQSLMDLLTAVGDTISALWDTLTSVLGYVGRVFSSAVNELFKFEESGKKAGGVFKFINDGIRSTVSFFENLNDKIKSVSSYFSEKKIDPEKSFGGIKTIRSWVVELLNILGKVKDKIAEGFNIKFSIPKIPSIKNIFGSQKVSADEIDTSSSIKGYTNLDNNSSTLNTTAILMKQLGKEAKNTAVITDELGRKTGEFNNTLNNNVKQHGLVKGSLETGKQSLTEYSGTINKVKSEAEKGTTGIGESFNRMFTDLKSRFENLDETVPKLVKGFFGGLEKAIRGTLNFIGIIIDGFKELSDKLQLPKGVSKAFKELGELLSTITKGVSIQDVNSLLQTLIMFKMFQQFKGNGIGDYLDGIKEKFQAFKDFFTSPFDITKGGMFEGIGKLMNSFNRKTNMQALKEGALAVLALAGALLVLSLIPEDKFPMIIKSLGMIAVVIGALSLAMWALSKLNLSKQGQMASVLEKLGLDELNNMFKKIGNGVLLVSLGATLLMFANAITKLAKVKWEQGLKAIKYIGLILAEIFIFMKLLDGASTKGNALTLLAIGISLTMMVGLVAKFKQVSNKDIDNGLWKMGKIMLLLAVCIALMGGKAGFGGVKIQWGDVKLATVGTILALTFAVKSIAKTITQLGSIDLITLAKGTQSVQTIMVVLSACIALMGGNAEFSGIKLQWGQVKLATVGTILSLAFAVWTIGNVVKQLGVLDAESLIKGTATVKAIATVLALCVALLGLDFSGFGIKVSTNNIKLGTLGGLIVMVLGIMALGAEVALLGSLPAENIQNGLMAVGYIAVILTAMVTIIANFGQMQWSGTAGVIAAVGGLVLIGGTIIRLGTLPKDKLNQGMLAVALISLAIVAITVVSSKFPATFTSVAALIATVLGIYAVGRIVETLSQIKNIQQGLLALGAITLAIGLVMGIAGIVGNFGGIAAIAVLLAAAGAIGILALSVALLAAIDGGALTVALIALTAGLGIILVAGALAIPLAPGLATLAVSVLAVGAGFMMFGVGALAVVAAATMLWNLIKTIWNDLMTFFSKLGEIIVNAWNNVASALSTLWSNITSNFSKWISEMPGKGLELMKKFGEGIVSFVGSIPEKVGKIKDAVVNFFANADWSSLAESGKALVQKFIDGLGSMIDGVKKKAGDIVQSVKDFFPNSPAKEGPLSGQGWVKLGKSGEALVEQWISGFNTSMISDTVGNAVDLVTNALNSVEASPIGNVVPVWDIQDNTPRGLPGLLDIANNSQRLNVDYQMLNPNGGTKYTVDTLVEGMNALNNRLYELQDKTDKQSQLIAEKQQTFVALDGRIVNKQLAPGMSDAQTRFNNKQTRVKKGELPIR